MDGPYARVYIFCLVFSAVWWTGQIGRSAHIGCWTWVLVTDRRGCFSFAGNCYLTGIIFARRKGKERRSKQRKTTTSQHRLLRTCPVPSPQKKVNNVRSSGTRLLHSFSGTGSGSDRQ
ncbi:hypothetical protein BDA96_06G098400 [Sorghum bicolor]|uniref:Uncharacterized protein n=2 Tax=Sorghum bicolor TaxID=4558 RepID=A0A921QS58_SORBI|nr:hypothetical protein BDA96_06G098400 [Sorghum bicolor]OQU81639.1 hypothetical protein SORBI_3006G089350 [Sorghum bicolor]